MPPGKWNTTCLLAVSCQLYLTCNWYCRLEWNTTCLLDYLAAGVLESGDET
jgi:hypothetical protein